MTGIFIKNTPSQAEIVANNYYNCNFNASVYNHKDNVYVFKNISCVELIEPIIPFSTTNINPLLAGDTIVELASTNGIIVGDRIHIGNYIYKITSINGNNITLSRTIMEDVISNSTVVNVGNLGIYKVEFTFPDIGEYTLIAKDTTFGLNIVNIIKVKEKSIETMYNDIKNLEYAILGN